MSGGGAEGENLFFLSLFTYFERERERERERECEPREGQRESQADSTGPDKGLDLTNQEITT